MRDVVVSIHGRMVGLDALGNLVVNGKVVDTPGLAVDVTNPEFAAPGDTFSDRLQRAIENSDGLPVFIPPGEYEVGLDYTLEDVDSVHLIGVPGKSILKYAADTAGLVLRAPYSAEYTVSAISTVSVGSGDGTDDNVTRLTITGGVSAFAENQTLKLYSQDASYYGSSSDKNYAGELVEVRSVDSGNNYVYLKSTAFNTYATSIRVRIIERKQVTLDGLTFAIDGDESEIYDDTLTVRRAALQLWGIYNPTIRNTWVKSAWAQCVNLIACWMPDVELRTDFVINGTDTTWGPGADALGYGCTTMTCYGGHLKLLGEGCRHLFTTLHPESPSYASSRWMEYGETIGTKISGISVNSHGSPFDTHESGIGLIFENCYVINPRRGLTGSVRSKGFSNRCRGTKHINCHVIGGYGAFLNMDIDHGAVHTVEYTNCSARDLYGTADAAFNFEGSTNAATVNMIGCNVRNSFRVMSMSGGKLYVSGGVFHIKGDWFARVLSGGSIFIHGALVDYSTAAGSDQFIRMSGTVTAVVTGTHIAGDTNCTGLFYDEDGSGTKTCRYGAVTSSSGTLAKSATGSATTITPTNILLS